jgi:formylmethanofuran dehydrogenase subunit E
MDYGKIAATFYNLHENRAVRVLTGDDSRDRAKESQTQSYIEMENSDLFVVTPVRAKLRQEGLLGIYQAVLAVTNAVMESTTREKWLLMIGLFVSPAQMVPIT